MVADIGASLAFYRRLGLDILADADAAPHVELALPGGLRLAWVTEDTIRSFAPDWTAPKGSSCTSLAFRLPDPAAVDAAYAELTGAGYHGEHPPWDAFWGQQPGHATPGNCSSSVPSPTCSQCAALPPSELGSGHLVS